MNGGKCIGICIYVGTGIQICIYFVALSYPHSAFSYDHQMENLRGLRATTFLFDSIFRCLLPGIWPEEEEREVKEDERMGGRGLARPFGSSLNVDLWQSVACKPVCNTFHCHLF